MNEHLKQTGRTTRMLDQAVALAKQGRAVYVVAPSRQHVPQWEDMLLDALIRGSVPQPSCLGIKIEAGVPPQFDWDKMRVPGAHPNSVWLLDHFVAEREITHITQKIAYLEMLRMKLYPMTL